MKAFSLTNGLLSTTPVAQSSASFGFPGATPSISSNSNQDGIVWAIRASTPATLHAFEAADIATELYNSNESGARDQPGDYVKFSVPTVANGKVYVGTQTTIEAYGCLPAAAPVITAPGQVSSGSTGLSASVPAHGGSTYAWTLVGGTITAGQGTAEITFTAGSPAPCNSP
jgi:hypothetical protein